MAPVLASVIDIHEPLLFVTLLSIIRKVCVCTVSQKSHDPCFRVFLMEAGVIAVVAHCT